MRRFLVGFLATLGLRSVLLLAGGVAVRPGCCCRRRPNCPSAACWWSTCARASRRRRRATRSSCLGIAVRPTFIDLVLALDRAGRDPRVRGWWRGSTARGRAWRRARSCAPRVARFREQGKFAYAYADSFGEFGPGTRGYYLATAFERSTCSPLARLA